MDNTCNAKGYKLTQKQLDISEMGNGNIGHYMEENNLSKFFFGKKYRCFTRLYTI